MSLSLYMTDLLPIMTARISAPLSELDLQTGAALRGAVPGKEEAVLLGSPTAGIHHYGILCGNRGKLE
jgi:hypothetical protein